MARRVLITGASGLLGRALYREFRRTGDWQVLGLAFSRAGGELKAVDLKDKTTVNQVVNEFKVDGVRFFSVFFSITLDSLTLSLSLSV